MQYYDETTKSFMTYNEPNIKSVTEFLDQKKIPYYIVNGTLFIKDEDLSDGIDAAQKAMLK